MGSHKPPATPTITRPTAFTGRKWVRWTAQKKAAFLDHLAATCNVKASAAVIGVDPISVYALRRHDPAFLAAWQEALEAGYAMLETQLVGHALSGGGRTIANGATALTGPIDVDLALRLLAAHRTRSADRPRRGGPPLQRASPDDTDAAILKKLRAIEKQQGKQQGSDER
ncbi:MAG: hypothetical protein B7Y45_07770 [Sphingomonas sp. 28-66-16]|nr:MAG: hypothetical protein B7Y45_07770 [Sphingomonas sp. 28-66-16]